MSSCRRNWMRWTGWRTRFCSAFRFHPGMTRSLGDAQSESLIQSIPLGRLGRSEDIAAAVLFLASPGASYITGTTLHVNGGMYMG